MDNFEVIKNIIESEDYLKDNIELYDGLSDDDLKFDVAYTKISNVIFEEEGSGGVIDRDIEFTVIVSIYNFDSLNKILNDNWGLALGSEYDNDHIESNDVSLCFSNLITGFYVNESNESFEIEWTSENGNCVLENKTIVSRF